MIVELDFCWTSICLVSFNMHWFPSGGVMIHQCQNKIHITMYGDDTILFCTWTRAEDAKIVNNEWAILF